MYSIFFHKSVQKYAIPLEPVNSAHTEWANQIYKAFKTLDLWSEKWTKDIRHADVFCLFFWPQGAHSSQSKYFFFRKQVTGMCLGGGGNQRTQMDKEP